MGIYDREYYRREGPGFLATITQHGRVCKWLIAVNIVMFVLQLATESKTRPQVVRDEDGQVARDEYGRVIVEPGSSASWITDTFILNTEAVMQGQVWRL